MSIIKDTVRAPMFIIIKMAVVYVLGKYILFTMNDMPFKWSNELSTTGFWVLILYIIYCIAAVIPPDGANSSPLFIHNEITKSINKQYFIFGRKIKEARGLYHGYPKFIDDVFYYEYQPIKNPLEVIYKAEAYIMILPTLNTGGADRLATYLETVIDEAKFMMDNKCETLLIQQP